MASSLIQIRIELYFGYTFDRLFYLLMIKGCMANRYFITLLSGLLCTCVALWLYFVWQKPHMAESTQILTTTYDVKVVPGAIQPIPTLKAIDEQWVKLGRALFHSPLLSKDNTISCASCHNINQGGDDGFPVSTGIDGQLGSRNSPTVLNAVFSFRQFWDGRSPDLADQAQGPIHNPIEMGSTFNEVINKLSKAPEFVATFERLNPEGITSQAIIKALVTFEESLITPNAAIDRYLLGDSDALTQQQKLGLEKFTSFGCVSCHQGVNIGGNLYQRLGRISEVPKKLLDDEGRFVLTQHKNDQFVFKVPSLRNITLTAPYFHNGSVSGLEEAVTIMAKGQLGLDLSKQDIEDLLALFEAFSGQLPNESGADK